MTTDEVFAERKKQEAQPCWESKKTCWNKNGGFPGPAASKAEPLFPPCDSGTTPMPATARSEATEPGYSARVWPGSEHEPRKNRRKDGTTPSRGPGSCSLRPVGGACDPAAAAPVGVAVPARLGMSIVPLPPVASGEWRQLARRVRHARTHLRPAGPHAPRRTRALSSGLSPSVSRRCRRRKTAHWFCLVQIFPCAAAPRLLQHCTEWYDLSLQVFVLRLEPVVSATGRAAVDGYFPWSMRAGPALGRTHVLPFVFRKL